MERNKFLWRKMSSVLDVLGSKKTGYPGGGKKAKWGFGTWEKDW